MLASDHGELSEIVYLLLLIGGLVALGAGAYIAAMRNQVLAGIVVAVIGVVMIVLAT